MDWNARSTHVTVLLAAVCVGAIAGVGSLGMSAQQVAAVPAVATATGIARGVAVQTGMVRARPPQPGDVWGGCNSARAAGTAPIYRGEPGYREDMDGDDDGIACEPIR